MEFSLINNNQLLLCLSGFLSCTHFKFVIFRLFCVIFSLAVFFARRHSNTSKLFEVFLSCFNFQPNLKTVFDYSIELFAHCQPETNQIGFAVVSSIGLLTLAHRDDCTVYKQ